MRKRLRPAALCGVILVLVGVAAAQSAARRSVFAAPYPQARGSQRSALPDVHDFNTMWSRGRAVGKGPVRFTHSPMHVQDIDTIIPYGLMVGAHVMPTDHGYFYPKEWQSARDYDVLAPAPGFIVQIGHRVKFEGTSERQREHDDYGLTIEHSATFYTQYDLLTKLDKSILDQLSASTRDKFDKKVGGSPHAVRIPVKAGQVIGKVAGRTLDFGVVNSEVTLKGFVTPAMYGHQGWRLHLVDPFDYFDEPLKSHLLALNPRKAEPRGGKIDYDIDGRLVGNWFKQGTGGFDGNRDPRGYWMGHLAIVYHHIDRSLVVVSIGDFDGRPRQFMVKGNGPDPAKVSAADGPVKYELVNFILDGYGRRSPNPPQQQPVHGVLLVQVLDERKLRVETFFGKTASEVNGFTTAAAIYER